MIDIAERLQQVFGDTVRIERELGGGGMARVFLATERALNRPIVIKVLLGEWREGSASADRFRREIALAASLQHPHIVPLLQAGEADGIPYYTMPYVEGESLRERLASGPLPVPEVIACVRDVARALAHAHERGVVHRDIKPDNILRSGEACAVTDFGIAKAVLAAREAAGVSGATITQVGTSLGTPAYMAPEQATADPAIDHRADLYALGCVAFELLTGRPPFVDTSPQKLLAAHLFEAPPSVELLRPETPPVLVALITRCLAKDPADRPAHAAELLRALETSGAQPVAAAPASPAASEPARPARPDVEVPQPVPPRHSRRVPWMAVTVVLLLAGVAGWSMGRDRPSAGGAPPAARTVSDRVLVVDIASPGTDLSLGPVVTEVIRTALAQAQSVMVLQQDQLADALRRMQRPETSMVDLTLAREIAQREGVKVIVDGKLLAVGGQFVLSLRMIAPRTGEVLGTFRETARGEGEILPTIDRATKGVRTALGESLGHVQASPPLEQVTTGSLEALRKYVEADRALDTDSDRALRLLHEATAIDTGFAMAYRKLAITYRNLEFPDSAERNMTRAFTFRSRLGEVERLLVEGSYYQFSRQADTAASRQAYEQLLEIRPDDRVALNNLALQYLELRRFTDAEALLRRAIAQEPYGVFQYTNLLMAVAQTKGRDEVRRVATAYTKVRPATVEALVVDALVAWALGDAESAHVQLTALQQQPLDGYTGPWFLRKVALVEGARGRLIESARLHREAAAWSEREGQEETRLGAEALAVLLQVMWTGDTTQAMQQLESAIRRTTPRLVQARNGAVIPAVVRALAAGGRTASAREWLARWDSLQVPLRLPHAAVRFGMVAEIAEAEGQWAEALRAWKASDVGSCTFCAAPGLARAYERLGARDSAIAAWEHFLAVPHYLDRVELDIRARADAHRRLAALYEAGGAPDRAITQLQAFVTLWKNADPALKRRVDEARAAIRRLQGRARS